jgi:hypothetical protein
MLKERGLEFAQAQYDKQHELEIAWAAGFFDGEGCIRINKTKRNNSFRYYLQIFVRQVDPTPIYKFNRLFEGSISWRERSVDTNSKARSIYTWSTAGPKAIKVLDNLYPYLAAKQTQADVAFEFQETLKYQGGYKLSEKQLQFREECFLKLKELKWQIYPKV